MVRKVEVEITGIRPLLMTRMPKDEEEFKKTEQLTKKLSSNPFDENLQKQALELCLHRSSDGTIFAPSDWILLGMVQAAKEERVKGKGKKTYKDKVRSQILIEPDEIPIEPQEYDIDKRWIQTKTKTRVFKWRPCWKQWKLRFNLIVLEDDIPLETLESILRYVGHYQGIGSFRGRFGLFEVSKFELQKEDERRE